MVTPDEIGQITIFAALEPAIATGCAVLPPTSGSAAGEYAAHEGDERALFGLLEGRIEAIRLVDGIERVVGKRHPGDIFGEVPITLGTVFPVGFRAAESSRVMRIEPHDYHAVAAKAPEVAQAGRQARQQPDRRPRRPAGPCGGAGSSSGDRARRPLDASCGELRRFLARNQIMFRWLQPDVPDDAEQWGARCPPTATAPPFAS